MSKLISVITPSLNSCNYIEDAIESVLIQDYKNFEHIIVDGGSTDSTVKILKKYNHLKWVSEPDNGQSHAMNKGFKMSKGNIIVYLNADDYFLPNVFKSIISYFNKGEKFVVGNIRVLMDDGFSWDNITKSIKFEDLLMHWRPNAYPVNPVGYFYLREVQEKVGGFNESSHFSMDIEFLIEAAFQFKFIKVEEFFGVYRFLLDTKTGRTQNKKKYWTIKKFDFVDKYLSSFSDDFVSRFKEERLQIFKKKNIEINEKLSNKRNYKKKIVRKAKKILKYLLKKRISDK